MWSPNPVLTVVSRGTSPDPWTMVFCGVEFGAERATVFEAPARAGAGTRTRSGRRPIRRRAARTGTSSTRDGTASNSPRAMAHAEPEHRSCWSTRPTPRRRATDARTWAPRAAGSERSSPPTMRFGACSSVRAGAPLPPLGTSAENRDRDDTGTRIRTTGGPDLPLCRPLTCLNSAASHPYVPLCELMCCPCMV